MEDVRDLCREMLETRSPSEQDRAQSDMEEMLHPPRPVTPALSVLTEASSTTSLGIVQRARIKRANLQNYARTDSILSPMKFQRTPQHSQVFDTKDSAKVAYLLSILWTLLLTWCYHCTVCHGATLSGTASPASQGHRRFHSSARRVSLVKLQAWTV